MQGGPPIALCDAPLGAGGSWGEDGNIIAALDIFGGRAWRHGIDRKLETLRGTYVMLNAEAQALRDFLALMLDFDSECDEIVGHNLVGFDLPFIFQRCLINGIAARPFVNLSEYNVRGVYDTMRAWWLGDRRSRVSLDDIAWALGIESSKTGEVEGSKVFDLYQAGKLAEIREYNLNDVRVTRKVYERLVACFGR